MALALTLAAAWSAGPSAATNVEPCTGTPRPIAPNVEDVLFEGELVPSFLGVNCLALDQTLSGASIDWGDGTTSPGKVTYETNSDGVSRQAWIKAPHGYLRARCVRGRHCKAFPVTATATDDLTGAPIVLHHDVLVRPGLLFPTPVRVTGRRGVRFHRQLTRVRSTGLRLPGELTARVRWGDGTRSSARVLGSGRRFVIVGTHRWRRSGRLSMRVAINDRFRGIVLVVNGFARIADRREER